ncbi:hypothetical protein BASA50_000409 [Batrachochytrium salamandrivorans]|uniref:Anaphase-promoting complex subunit 4 WD40 domain-containing protein n=1 Tax=Batrachochytrium salamandrivorans TaxID=1357716 RepID=A0ABQ8ETR7_9FUNG|nr:hypothetical protein BASA50_000409 [Batrachochytrium salamandrivorans]KAH9275480.1 hypothetical protein BASA83_002254 [Batrachochytrium salamandrivorans]
MADLAPGSNKATIKADHRAYAAESLSVERTGLCFQVSALAFINERILLAGVGPLLRVFDIHTNTLITEILVLDHSRIHGIRVHSSIVESIGSAVDKDECTILNPRVYKVAVFGGKHLRTLEITQTIRVDTGSPDISIRLLDPFPKFSDWILEAHWVKANKSSTEYSALVLVFSHNYVQAWSLETRMLLKHIQSEERCLLYAARCFGMCLEDVQVASGTVFGEVILWNMSEYNQEHDGRALKRLIGHEGVIFSIQYSSDGLQVASVSDDRSIRVWSTVHDDTMAHTCLQGHLARVWDAMFVQDRIVSISEDATCCIWDIRSGNCLARLDGHDVKHVWGLAVDPSHSVIATGGGDGGIRLWGMKDVAESQTGDHGMVSVSLLKDCEPAKRAEFPRAFSFVRENCVLIFSSHGRFVLWNEIDQTQTLIHKDLRFASYVVQAVVGNGLAAITATIGGDLLLFSLSGKFQPLEWKHTSSGKIVDIFLLDRGAHSDCSSDSDIIVLTHEGEYAVWYKLSGLDGMQGSPVYSVHANLIIPGKNSVTAVSLQIAHQVVVIGTRSGSVIAYDALGDNGSQRNLEPVLVSHSAHGDEALTDILVVDSAVLASRAIPNTNTVSLMLYTVGRDGYFCKYVLHRQDMDGSRLVTPRLPRLTAEISRGGWTLHRTHQSRLTKGWLEQIIFVNGTILVGGFYDKQFFVYNQTKKFKMLSVPCGGSHRQWHFQTSDEHLNHASFAFIRGGNLMVLPRRPSSHACFADSKLQDNYHGRETRSVVIANFPDMKGSVARLVISAGEDGLLTYHKYDPSLAIGRTLHRIDTTRKHSGAIIGLSRIDSCNGHLFFFSAGAREDLRCWQLEIPEWTYDSHNIECIDVAKAPSVSLVSETRILSVSAVLLSRTSLGLNADFEPISTTDDRVYHLVATGCSDAVIRIWIFDHVENIFIFVGQSDFHGRCVQQVKLEKLCNESVLVLMTGATDGRVVLWDLTYLVHEFFTLGKRGIAVDGLSSGGNHAIGLGSPVHTWQQHQSGIKAMDIWVHPETAHASSTGSQVYIATGGDDNSVAMLHICILAPLAVAKTTVKESSNFVECRLGVHTVNRSEVSSAHASALGGVTILDHHHLLTVSIDQRLILWRIHPDTLNLTFKSAVLTDVPDISGMAVAASSCDHGSLTIALVGFGLQMLTLQM